MNYSDEEKIKRLLDAQEHPEHYTDEELREIIRDARPLARLKRALVEERAEDEEIDVEKAWKAFSQSRPDSSCSKETETTSGASPKDSHPNGPLSRHRIPRWMHVAAVFLGCVFLAGVTFAAMTRLGWIHSPFAAKSRSWRSALPSRRCHVTPPPTALRQSWRRRSRRPSSRSSTMPLCLTFSLQWGSTTD